MPAIVQAKAAVKALLEANRWPVTSPVIRWGGPTESEDFPRGGELIYFADSDFETSDDSLRLGRTAYDEAFTIRIVIDVRRLGDDEQGTEARAWQLYDAVAALLDNNANRTLSGTVNRLAGRTVRQTNIPLPQEWLARITVEQNAVAHIVNV